MHIDQAVSTAMIRALRSEKFLKMYNDILWACLDEQGIVDHIDGDPTFAGDVTVDGKGNIVVDLIVDGKSKKVKAAL